MKNADKSKKPARVNRLDEITQLLGQLQHEIVSLKSEVRAGRVDVQPEQELTPAAEPIQVVPMPEAVKCVEDIRVAFGGEHLHFAKGEVVSHHPSLIRFMIENGLPVVAVDEDCKFQSCPKCHRRQVMTDTAPVQSGIFLRPTRDFHVSVNGRLLRFAPKDVIDDQVVVRELLEIQLATQQLPTVKVIEGVDFIRCECAMVYFPDNKLRVISAVESVEELATEELAVSA